MQSIPNPAGQALYALPPGYRILNQSFEFKNGGQGSLYWSGILYQSNLPFEAGWRIPPGQAYPAAVDPFRGADLYGAVNSTASYQVESLVLQASEAQLRAAGRDTPDFIQQRYTSLPAEVPERVYALARSLTSAAATQYDEALAIESYLRTNYPYTLDVPEPPGGQDVADYFLFDLKRGYCDYYATAMVVLARSVGLPARMVMGYASGSYNPLKAEYVVTGADAHAWVEIYFPGLGWVEFEPTAGRPAFDRAAPGTDAARVEPIPARPLDKLVRSVYGMPSYLRWVLVGLAGVIGLAGLFFLLEGWLLGMLPPSASLRWMYRSLYRQARRFSGAMTPGQTASEFAQALQAALVQPDEHLEQLTGLYLKNLFSSQPLQKAELLLAVRAWRGLRWKLLWTRRQKTQK